MMNLVRLLARLLLAAMFLAGGADAVRKPESKAPKVEQLGLPQPVLAAKVNGGVMVTAGAALALGVRPRLAATVLAISLVPTTLAGHRFWEFEGADRAQQKIHFTKNLGLLGGLLWVATDHHA